MNHNSTKKNIKEQLSSHLFWDIPLENIDLVEHSGFVVERVMRYGMIEDWKFIQKWYGKEGLRNIVVELRDLDKVSISFLSAILDLKKEDFRCYKETQSLRSFWES